MATEPVTAIRRKPKTDLKHLPRFISRHTAAKDCGVTRAAVIKAIRTGAIRVQPGDKIDRQSPGYISYREQAIARKAASKASAQNRDVSQANAATVQGKRAIAGPMRSRRRVFGTKVEADIAKVHEQVEALQLKNERERAELLPRDQVRRVLSKFYSVESTEFLSLGDRISPEIAAAASIDKPEVVIAVGQMIRREVERTLQHIERVIADYLSAIPVEEESTNAGDAEPD